MSPYRQMDSGAAAASSGRDGFGGEHVEHADDEQQPGKDCFQARRENARMECRSTFLLGLEARTRKGTVPCGCGGLGPDERHTGNCETCHRRVQRGPGILEHHQLHIVGGSVLVDHGGHGQAGTVGGVAKLG